MNRENKYSKRQSEYRSRFGSRLISDFGQAGKLRIESLRLQKLTPLNNAGYIESSDNPELPDSIKSSINSDLSLKDVNKQQFLPISSMSTNIPKAGVLKLPYPDSLNFRLNNKILLILLMLLLGIILIFNISVLINNQNKAMATNSTNLSTPISLVSMSSYQDPSLYDECPVVNLGGYNVEANSPRYISFTGTDLNARVINLPASDNLTLETSKNIFDASWYSQSAKPGNKGSTIITGRVSGPTSAGLFYKLDQLPQGSKITLETGNGQKYSYTIGSISKISSDNFNLASLSESDTDKNKLVIVTRMGERKNDIKTHNQLMIVSATLEN